jgi:hypothetical protein
MKSFFAILLAAGFLSTAPPAQGQDAGGNRLMISFSDPQRPGLLRVNIINGAIEVRPHAGREVIIETRGGNNRNRVPAPPNGARRLDTNSLGLNIEEENNVINVTSRFPNDPGNLSIQVPGRTNLYLKTVNGGNINVEGIEGEIEISNTNGSITINNVAGSVVANATNGRVVASLRDMLPNKPIALASMNGNVEVTLPSTTKANLKVHTDNGETITEFEILVRPSALSLDDSRNRGGRFRLQRDRTINGTINGGGPDIDLRTLNGNIYIRRGK